MSLLLVYFLSTTMGYAVGPFPRQSVDNLNTIISESALQVVANVTNPPGNIAVSSGGRIFFTFHPVFKPRPIKVAELVDSVSVAFPDENFQGNFDDVLSLRVDKQNRLWLLDHASGGVFGFKSPKFHVFMLDQPFKGDSNLTFTYTFPRAVAALGSMLNDFQIDPAGKYAYIADTGILNNLPALVVLDIEKMISYRILPGHDCLFGNSYYLKVYHK